MTTPAAKEIRVAMVTRHALLALEARQAEVTRALEPAGVCDLAEKIGGPRWKPVPLSGS
jgi:hypothetical protein